MHTVEIRPILILDASFTHPNPRQVIQAPEYVDYKGLDGNSRIYDSIALWDVLQFWWQSVVNHINSADECAESPTESVYTKLSGLLISIKSDAITPHQCRVFRVNIATDCTKFCDIVHGEIAGHYVTSGGDAGVDAAVWILAH